MKKDVDDIVVSCHITKHEGNKDQDLENAIDEVLDKVQTEGLEELVSGKIKNEYLEYKEEKKKGEQVKTNDDLYSLLLDVQRTALSNGNSTLEGKKQEFAFSTKLLKIANETKAKLTLNNIVTGTVLFASGIVIGTAYEAWMPYVQVMAKFLAFWK